MSVASHGNDGATREAPYLALYESGELARRVEALERLLTRCMVFGLFAPAGRRRGR
jgi:hypothetical protein